MPKVSVLIASYNHEKYIGYAIQSVLGQTYQDFEIVIVDDGSKDNSVEVIRSFTDPRIRLICFEQNQGACTAAKRLLQEAKGEYIAILNSDDAFLPEKLAKQVDFLDRNDKYGAVFSYAQIIDEAGEIFTDENHFYSKIFVQENKSRHEWLRYFFYNGNCLCHPSIMIRSECYESVGFYDERYYQLPDFDFWIRLCLKYEIYIIPENLIEFRVRENEANASGDNYTTKIRCNNELVSVLERFLLIKSEKEFLDVFPDKQELVNENGFDLEYAVASVCMSNRNSKMHVAFGLQLLFRLLNNPNKRSKLMDIYNFSYQDLYQWSKKCDVFAVCLVDTGLPQVYIKRENSSELERADIDVLELGNTIQLRVDLKNSSNITQIHFIPIKGWSCKCKLWLSDRDCRNIRIYNALVQKEYTLIDVNPTIVFTGEFNNKSFFEFKYAVKLFELGEMIERLKVSMVNNDSIVAQNENLTLEKQNLLNYQKKLQENIEDLQEDIDNLTKQVNIKLSENDMLKNKLAMSIECGKKIADELHEIHQSRGYQLLNKCRNAKQKVKKILG